MKNNDIKLSEIFDQQTEIMEKLRSHGLFPDWPFDLSKKESQRFCKTIAFEAMGELFEAMQHLKNSKPHRASDIPTFDREELLEELVDVTHYLVEIFIMLGISQDEFLDAFTKKTAVVLKRIEDGY